MSGSDDSSKPSSTVGRLAAIGRQLLPSSALSTSSTWKSSDGATSAATPGERRGTLRLGSSVELPVFAPHDETRLPDPRLLLDLHDPVVRDHLEWLARKYSLKQDAFLISPPGPFARRLALTFAALLQLPVEHVSLHRDVGESELIQTRNLAGGTTLTYQDGPVVRAMKRGSILILEGVERAERASMPLLNNLIENREMGLADGTHLVPRSTLEKAKAAGENQTFIPVSDAFFVIAIGLPVPPYKGLPLDPPFRSRFQGRWVEGVVPSTLSNVLSPDKQAKELSDALTQRFFEWASLVRLHGTAATADEVLPPAERLPNVPATALSLLSDLAARFPPAVSLPPLPSFDETDDGTRPTAPNLPTAPPRNGALQVHESTRARVEARETEQLKQYAEDQAKNKKGDGSIAPSTRALLGAGYPMLHTLDPTRRELAADLLAAVSLHAGVGGGGAEVEEGKGLLGYRVTGIVRAADDAADATFEQEQGRKVTVRVPAGPLQLAPLPLVSNDKAAPNGLLFTPRLAGVITSMLQLHAVGRDVILLPSALAADKIKGEVSPSSSSSTSTSIGLFASLLGYPHEGVHLYKDLGGGELIARRATTKDGSTTWEAAPLLRGALSGTLVHLSGIDVLGPTLGALARLTQDREAELWSGGRAALPGALPSVEGTDIAEKRLTTINPSFRVIGTASSSKPEWLNEEASALFSFVAPAPMSAAEELSVIVSRSGARPAQLEPLLAFTARYRALAADPALGLQASRRLGTRALIRIATRITQYPWTDLYATLARTLLIEFLPRTTAALVQSALSQTELRPRGSEGAFQYVPPEHLSAPEIQNGVLSFRNINAPGAQDNPQAGVVNIPLYDAASKDPAGLSLVPTMEHFYDNPAQSALLRDIGIDLLENDVLLMGNQGTGKNKLIDRLAMLIGRPREYVQLHRDSSVSSILQQVQLVDGQLTFLESPLVRAIRTGRLCVIDEADKCPASVTAIFRSLAERRELTLPDGRRVRPEGSLGSDKDVVAHPDFRLVLLANRPGHGFQGSDFLSVIGEGFAMFQISNPSHESEVALLRQVGPHVDPKLIKQLDLAWCDLRDHFDQGSLHYPLSMRELIHIVRHLERYPAEQLVDVLLNTLSFDLQRPEVMELVARTLAKRGLNVKGLSLAAIRQKEEEKQKVDAGRVEFDPESAGRDTNLDKPKEGKTDPDNKEHSGGNTWRGGTGGRDTAGLGGRGGYERLYSGHEIKQIPDSLKRDVPEHIKEQARQMAKEALAKKLAEEGMTAHEGATLQAYKLELAQHINNLVLTLNQVQTAAKERQWLKRQEEGQLDESRLTDALTGDKGVMKRRAEQPPDPFAPQTKPKRIRILVDVSASMYSMQYDGRLDRELKTVLMVMEAFARTEPGKYVYDIWGHSGESDHIPLVMADKPPASAGDRWRVLRDMTSITQYTMSGDSTLESIRWGCRELTKEEADDYFVIALSDANLGRYGITTDMLAKALRSNEKVKGSVIFLDGRSSEGKQTAAQLPGLAYSVIDLRQLPQTFGSLLEAALHQ
ncbi:AAA ATPase containing von Willebrand factor type A (vWA) domain [Ceraceosorus bombacis]|uniref:AAA ATPase containing von Willebrand factor type A (VWA) domain n=1 Tax=Ceraceosorus bombacis TaxID=401625 RepID=A0A0P1BQ39_9BASI|nr:AAA ATPase containing von Willebrand factor type A (vWA) domain [Ceraceosorus bombacis]